MITGAVLAVGVCFLAYSNGSNDNFKGVATLFGSGTTNYRMALLWATATTFAGSVCSVFLAETLVENFSGKGLVPDAVLASPEFLQAVVVGAGLCVMVATVSGLPISTTHSLTGALVGAGFIASGSDVNLTRLGSVFFLPLLLSPFIALALASLLYVVLRRLRKTLGIGSDSRVCLGERSVPVSSGPETAVASTATLDENVADKTECGERYVGSFMGVDAKKALDTAHYLSAGVVSFARGLNDTPKIVGALVAAKAFGLHAGIFLVAVAMAVGGLMQSRKVAHTISKKITPLNDGQGLTANLVTGFLVVFASRIGVPVSTTHISVGSLFGIGTVTGNADKGVVARIVAAWVFTLPLAAGFAAGGYWVLETITR